MVDSASGREHQDRQTAEHQDRQTAEQRDRELRHAYADWLAANQRALVAMITVQASRNEQRDPQNLVATINAEISVFGSRLRLLEPDPGARKKTTEALELLSVFAAKIAVGDAADHASFLDEVAGTARRLAEIEEWVVEERFGGKTVLARVPGSR